jgi:hypothetical protein
MTYKFASPFKLCGLTARQIPKRRHGVGKKHPKGCKCRCHQNKGRPRDNA